MNTNYDKIFEEIHNYVLDLSVIDTHEHLTPRDEWRNKEADIIAEYLIHYFNRDLYSAGMSKEEFAEVCNASTPIAERWKTIEPYWEEARHTGYGRVLDLNAKGLYGIDEINGETIEALNEKFKAKLNENRYEEVLKNKCHIVTSLLNHPQVMDADKDYFTQVYHMDVFVSIKGGYILTMVEKDAGMKIRSMDDFFEAVEKVIDNMMEKGIRVFKCGLAYDRSLQFDRYTRHEAEEEFNHIYNMANYYIDRDQQVYSVGKAFQDYAMHYFMKLADRRGLVVQFHTGLHEGSGNIIANSNPEKLSNLCLEYPNVKFDIFHIGYPYEHVLSAMAKNFPNVYIDMCWAHAISPHACVMAMVEWLDAVPTNKILAFGGDYIFIDGVYGHLMLAKENVSKALALKVSEKKLKIEKAKLIAKKWFYDNPAKLYGLE